MPTPKKVLASGRVPERKAGKLTEQQELFCQKFLLHLNASRAYQEAFSCTHKAAQANAHRLMANEGVLHRISELKKERRERLDISKDRVLRLLIERVETKLDDVMEWSDKKITLKDSKKLKLRTRRNLRKVGISETKYGTDKTVELKDDGVALTLLAKHVGLFDKENGADSEPQESVIDRVLGALQKHRR